MKIFLDETPLAKKRPRFARRGKMTIAYDVQLRDKMDTKGRMLLALDEITLSDDRKKQASASAAFYSDTIEVTFRFHFLLPESSPTAEKNRSSWGLLPHNSKPDIDNLVKYYLDCGNGILWSDDRIIDKITAEKLYSRKQGVEIEIRARKRRVFPKICEVFMSKIDEKLVESFMEETARILEAFCDYKSGNGELSLEEFTSRLATYCHFAHPFVSKAKKASFADLAKIHEREIRARDSI